MSAKVTTGDCSGAGGPNITLSGELALRGICTTIIFTNNDRFTHVHEEDATIEIVLIPAGQKQAGANLRRHPFNASSQGEQLVFVSIGKVRA